MGVLTSLWIEITNITTSTEESTLMKEIRTRDQSSLNLPIDWSELA